jgi:hypothetical protein
LTDLQLMDRSKDEGRAEVYENYYLSTMPLFRRICTLTYVAWLFVEGLISVFHTRSPATIGTRMEPYLIIAGLVFVILHSYLRQRVPRYLFPLLVFVHQVTLAGMSLSRYVRLGIQDHAGAIVRLFLFSFCILAEVEGFTLDNILYFNRRE